MQARLAGQRVEVAGTDTVLHNEPMCFQFALQSGQVETRIPDFARKIAGRDATEPFVADVHRICEAGVFPVLLADVREIALREAPGCRSADRVEPVLR